MKGQEGLGLQVSGFIMTYYYIHAGRVCRIVLVLIQAPTLLHP